MQLLDRHIVIACVDIAFESIDRHVSILDLHAAARGLQVNEVSIGHLVAGHLDR
jgi:hypothetical protein